jgi:predicted TIM-barrel fold metal-dependent hydrolase
MTMHDRLSRRDIVRAAVGGMAGLAGCAVTEKARRTVDASGTPGWIDAHVHVWTDDVQRYPLAPGFKKEDMQPATFTPEELFAHCEPCGVRRINLIQMSYYGCDNRYMLDAMARYSGRFAGTAIVDVTAPSVGDEMRRLRPHGVRAFRIYPDLAKRQSADWLRPEGYDEMFKVGAECNMAMSCLMGPADLPELDRMCTRYPDTPVIIDHLCRIGITGQIDPKEVDALCRMSRHKRVMVKVGAFYALGSRKPPYDDLIPLIRHVVQAFGPQRCMWETDCPFQVVNGTYAASLALIRDRCTFLSQADREQILRKTAEAFFFGEA